MILGAHLPIREGLAAAAALAGRLGCAALQVFPYRRHEEISARQAEAFREACREAGVTRLLTHARYVPCLGASDGERRRRSSALLERELRLSAALGAEAHVVHIGAWSEDSDREEGLRLAAEAARRAVSAAGYGRPLLFENVPGGGRRMGGGLEDLARLLERGEPSWGVCIDTAHGWAAGWDLSSAEGMLKLLSRLHRLVGCERVGAFHLNDSRALLGSRKENHAPWGGGYLGAEGVKVLLERPEYRGVPGIVESPAPGSCLAFLAKVAGASSRA